jgi:hypothetical protein
MKQQFKPRVLRKKSKVADPLRIPFVTTGGLDGEILSSQQQGSIGTPPYTSCVPLQMLSCRIWNTFNKTSM